MGAELAATLVGFALLGLYIDRTFDTSPWAILVSLAVGSIGGFYNFIRSSLRELQPPPTSGRSGSTPGPPPSTRLPSSLPEAPPTHDESEST